MKYRFLPPFLLPVTCLRLLTVVCVLLLPVGTAYAEVAVDSIRISQDSQRSRIIFDLSKPVKHRIFMLSNPERIVLDLPDARINATLAGKYKKPLVSIRHARVEKSLARVIVVLAKPSRVSNFSLAPQHGYGHRLVIDVLPTNAPNPVKITKAKSNRDVLIAIDAGHGGKDFGAVVKGVHEKTLVLEYARMLAKEISRRKGLQAILTRNGDYKVKLSDRILKARVNRADLFLSIHANAFPKDKRVSGFMLFALSGEGASSEVARWLERSENKTSRDGTIDELLDSDLKAAKNLRKVILDLSMTSVMNQSLLAGRTILAKVAKVTKLHSTKVETASFAVLKAPDVPALLLELGFISNVREVKKLTNKKFRSKLIVAVTNGIESFFLDYPPPGTRLASLRENRLGNPNLYYTVRKNDTISEIALEHKVPEAQLRKLNNLQDHTILIGQKLRLRKK